MIWLIKFLIFGHAHKWEEFKTWKMQHGCEPYVSEGMRFFCRCTKCGSIRKFDCF